MGTETRLSMRLIAFMCGLVWRRDATAYIITNDDESDFVHVPSASELLDRIARKTANAGTVERTLPLDILCVPAIEWMNKVASKIKQGNERKYFANKICWRIPIAVAVACIVLAFLASKLFNVDTYENDPYKVLGIEN